MQTATINAAGLAQIAQFLRKNHKDGDRIASQTNMLHAWAADAENSLGNSNPAMIEISSRDSISGRPETFTVDADGIDIEFVADDE